LKKDIIFFDMNYHIGISLEFHIFEYNIDHNNIFYINGNVIIKKVY
jgi:hypothetical protein